MDANISVKRTAVVLKCLYQYSENSDPEDGLSTRRRNDGDYQSARRPAPEHLVENLRSRNDVFIRSLV